MTQPLVSVIVPVYNTESHLPLLLDSVLAQSLAQIELICVDNGSRDLSVAIIRDYARRDPRVRLAFEQRRGAAAARNKGIALATGRYCIFFDSDDYCPNPAALEILSRQAEQRHADVVRGNHMMLTQETGALSRQRLFGVDLFLEREGGFPWFEEPVLWIPWTHQVFLIRKDFLTSQGILYPEYLRGQDPPFLLAVLLAAGTLYCVSDIVYVYRNSLRRWDDFVWVDDSCEHYLKHLYDVRRMLLERSFERQWRVYAAHGVRKLAELLPVAVASERGASRRLILDVFSDLWSYRDLDPAPFEAYIEWDLLFLSLFACHQIETGSPPGPYGVRFLGARMRLQKKRVAGLVVPLSSRLPGAMGGRRRNQATGTAEPVSPAVMIKCLAAEILRPLGLFSIVRRMYRILTGRS